MEVLAKSKGPTEKDGRNALRKVAPLLLHEARTSKNSRVLIELGDLGEPEAVAALLEQLRDADPATKAGAAAALDRLGSLAFRAEDVDAVRIRDELRGCVTPLVTALDDPTPDVRRWAAQALPCLGTASLPAIPALQKAAEREPDQFVRHAMIDACRSINLSAELERARNGAAREDGGNRHPQ
jgi:HEAT repeat protein